jgi:hypothetical protein
MYPTEAFSGVILGEADSEEVIFSSFTYCLWFSQSITPDKK